MDWHWSKVLPEAWCSCSRRPHLVLEAVHEVCQLRQPVLLGAGGHGMLCLQQQQHTGAQLNGCWCQGRSGDQAGRAGRDMHCLTPVHCNQTSMHQHGSTAERPLRRTCSSASVLMGHLLMHAAVDWCCQQTATKHAAWYCLEGSQASCFVQLRDQSSTQHQLCCETSQGMQLLGAA